MVKKDLSVEVVFRLSQPWIGLRQSIVDKGAAKAKAQRGNGFEEQKEGCKCLDFMSKERIVQDGVGELNRGQMWVH